MDYSSGDIEALFIVSDEVLPSGPSIEGLLEGPSSGQNFKDRLFIGAPSDLEDDVGVDGGVHEAVRPCQTIGAYGYASQRHLSLVRRLGRVPSPTPGAALLNRERGACPPRARKGSLDKVSASRSLFNRGPNAPVRRSAVRIPRQTEKHFSTSRWRPARWRSLSLTCSVAPPMARGVIGKWTDGARALARRRSRWRPSHLRQRTCLPSRLGTRSAQSFIYAPGKAGARGQLAAAQSAIYLHHPSQRHPHRVCYDVFQTVTLVGGNGNDEGLCNALGSTGQATA